MMMGRYAFWTIFEIDPTTGLLKPKFNVIVNGALFNRGTFIQKGLTFGGINLYNYMGKTIGGIWNPQTRTLTITGFYD